MFGVAIALTKVDLVFRVSIVYRSLVASANFLRMQVLYTLLLFELNVYLGVLVIYLLMYLFSRMLINIYIYWGMR